jgi:activator of HSP90 ATPase
MSTSLHQEITFRTTPQQFYEAYVDEKKHSTYTGLPAKIIREEGGSFSCYGGEIVGRIIELVKNKRIVQAWRPKGWPEGIYSLVKLELTQKGDNTIVTLDHWGFPEGGEEHLATGWNNHYWEPLEKYFGN